jgi:hypothetical protein
MYVLVFQRCKKEIINAEALEIWPKRYTQLGKMGK